MARTLYLFSGITPNVKGQPYFNIKNFSNYLNYLRTHYTLVATITDDNYRINKGEIAVSSQSIGNAIVTYAIEIDGDFHRCYFVNDITSQSKMILLPITLDYWGTYYLASRISYLHVTRCNRNIAIGIYDDVKSIDAAANIEAIFPDGQYYNDVNDLALVLQLSYNFVEHVIGKDMSTGGLFWTNLGRISDYTGAISLLTKITLMINGIYGVTSNSLVINNDAICTKAWIVPKDLIAYNDEHFIGNVEIKTKYKNLESELFPIISTTFEAFRLPAEINFVEMPFQYDINKDYIAGTFFGEGIKLTRTTKDIGRSADLEKSFRFGYKAVANGSDLKIYVFQGQKEKDITSAFELAITGKTEVQSGLAVIGQVLGSVTSAIKSFNRNGTIGLLGNLGQQLSQIDYSNCENQIQGSGGALVTYGMTTDIYQHKLQKPFVVMAYESAFNEVKNARYNGATFDKFFEDINDIFEFELLGNADYDLTYLVADEVMVNDLPTTPRNLIEKAFNEGVELFDYEGSTNN